MFSRNWRHVYNAHNRSSRRFRVTYSTSLPLLLAAAPVTVLYKSENEDEKSKIELENKPPQVDANCPNSIALNLINASILAIQHTGSKIEKMLKTQTQKYLDLTELDQQLFEAQHGAEILVGKKVDMIEMEIIDCRMDIGELEIDLETENRLFENSLGIGENAAKFAFEVGDETLAISLNGVLEFWKGVVERENVKKKAMFRKYYERHAEIIEKTNKDLLKDDQSS